LNISIGFAAMALLCSACLETSGSFRRIAKTQAEDACVYLAQDVGAFHSEARVSQICYKMYSKESVL
jgi:hypothetical protein